MALSQRHRASIYQSLESTLGREETEALLAELPAREADEPITRDYLDGRLGDLRTDLATELGSIRAGMAIQTRTIIQWVVALWISGVLLAFSAAQLAG